MSLCDNQSATRFQDKDDDGVFNREQSRNDFLINGIIWTAVSACHLTVRSASHDRVLDQSAFPHTPQSRCHILISQILKDADQRTLISKLSGQDAQAMADYLDTVSHDPNILGASNRRRVLALLCSLVKSAQVFPKSYRLTGVEFGGRPVSAGGFADVYRGQYKNRAVCLKALRAHQKPQGNERIIKTCAAELTLWAHLRHENVLPFYGVCLLGAASSRLCLVSPWMEQGSLRGYMKKFPENPRMVFIPDILNGLSYLHSLQVVHNDLKAENILVSDGGHALIADFGLSSIAATSQLMAVTSTGGTTRWMAPELLIGEGEPRATKSSDIWSFACLCYEILAGTEPYHQYNQTGAILAMIKKEIPLRPTPSDGGGCKEISDQLWNLLLTCWDYVPENRPSCEVLQDSIKNLGIQDDRSAAEAEASPALESQRESFNPRVDYVHVGEILLQISQLSDPTATQAGDGPESPPEVCEVGDKGRVPFGLDPAEQGQVETIQTHAGIQLQARSTGETEGSAQPESVPHTSIDTDYTPYKNLDGRVGRLNETIHPDHNGGFADLFIGYFIDDGTSFKVAIKVLRMTKDVDVVERIRKYLIRETVVWQQLHHPNVLGFLGLAHDHGRFGCPALITPYCDKGTVIDYLKLHPEIDTRLFMIKGVSEGLRYLHEQGVIHGDLKPSNILIHDNGSPLLCDFGRSKLLTQRGFTTKPAGACRYQSPELLQGIGPNKATDVYAFALSSYEIWTGLQPFHDIHQEASIILNVIMREARPEYPDPVPLGTEFLWKIFEDCWKHEPEERLGIEVVVQELAKISIPPS